MRYYEIVFMIHPDQSEFISQIIDDCKKNILNLGGVLHYFEDWGRRQLSYPINKLHKSHYILMNIEISNNGITKLVKIFNLNEYIMRIMVIKIKSINKAPSSIMKSINDNKVNVDINV